MRRFPKLPPRIERLVVSEPLYFVIVCTYRRRSVLARSAVHEAFVAFARRAQGANETIAVGRYVIMPDHLHLFVRGTQTFDLGRWVGMLKQHLAKAIARPTTAEPVWQRGFFDHILRSDESYGQKWEYVRENPLRAGLVSHAEDWPYAGEITVIDRV
jgi:REP element-mobilizing transposase RayT